jgi:hypothetical protein
LFRGLLNPRADPDISAFLTHEEAHQILVAMVDNLLPEVYLLGDSVIAQGEMGREMFFLVKGRSSGGSRNTITYSFLSFFFLFFLFFWNLPD